LKNNFNEYAQFYDHFNLDKNYQAESFYIDYLIKKFSHNALNILDVGCGTGKHATELAKLKYDVVGIDISKEMIEIANKREKESKLKLKFIYDLEQNYTASKEFDVIVSLFHVMSYQIHEYSLSKFFNLVSRNLKMGGIFIFDYWYTPAVRHLKIEERTKSFILNDKLIQKRSRPTAISSNLYNIDITISSENYLINEAHLMRSFVPKDFQKQNNFKLRDSFAWLTNEDPKLTNWAAVTVLQKI
jgi:predicted TPR repeat methyltransferase